MQLRDGNNRVLLSCSSAFTGMPTASIVQNVCRAHFTPAYMPHADLIGACEAMRAAPQLRVIKISGATEETGVGITSRNFPHVNDLELGDAFGCMLEPAVVRSVFLVVSRLAEQLESLELPLGPLLGDHKLQGLLPSALSRCLRLKTCRLLGMNVAESEQPDLSLETFELGRCIAAAPVLQEVVVNYLRSDSPICSGLLQHSRTIRTLKCTVLECLPGHRDARFWRAVAGSRTLEDLTWISPKLTDEEGQKALDECMATNTCLTSLSLGDHPFLPVVCCRALADGLARNGRNRLRSLDLPATVEDDDQPHGGRLVGLCPQLQEIWLDALDDAGVQYLVNGLKEASCNLKKLSVANLFANKECRRLLLQALRCCPCCDSLENFLTQQSNFDDSDAPAIADWIRDDTKLESLDIECDSMRSDGAITILRALAHNDTLLSVDLSLVGGDQGSEVLLAMADTLRANHSLVHWPQTLPLRTAEGGGGQTRAQSKESQALLAALASNRSICSLSVQVCDALWNEHGMMLLEAVASNPSLDAIEHCRANPRLDETTAAEVVGTLSKVAPSMLRFPGEVRCADTGMIRPVWDHTVHTEDRRAFVDRMLRRTEPPSADEAVRLLGVAFPQPQKRFELVPALVLSAEQLRKVFRFVAEAITRALDEVDFAGCSILAQRLLRLAADGKQQQQCGREWGGVFDAARRVCRAHRGCRRGEPGGEWVGAVKRCMQLGEMEAKHRSLHLLLWMRAHRVRRDAGMVFKAASEGRPLELGKRLRVGVLGGGHHARGMVRGADGVQVDVSALEAAQLGGHDGCVRLLKEAMG